jgi:hypothetical protein
LKTNLVSFFNVGADIVSIHVNTSKSVVVVVGVVVELGGVGWGVVVEWARHEFIEEVIPCLSLVTNL